MATAEHGSCPHQIKDCLFSRFLQKLATEATDNNMHTSEEILSATCESVSTDDVAENASHLTEEQRSDLKIFLRKFPSLFSGKLGKYPHKLVHIDVNPAAKP
jgi:hypothetical protein